jgi:hypothetical protein
MTTLLTQLYIRVCILPTRGKHVHGRIISLRGEIWAMNYNVMIYNTKNEKQKIPRCRNIYKINSKNRYNRSNIVFLFQALKVSGHMY